MPNKGGRNYVVIGKRPVIVPIGPSIAYVQLTQGYYALIDSDNAEWVGKHNWSVKLSRKGRNDTFYAKRVTDDPDTGKQTVVYLHRTILGLEYGAMGDHSNGNGLNNMRYNLRPCTHSQNLQNRPKPRNNTTGFKGVSIRSSGLHVAKIKFSGKEIHIGYFRSKEQASAAYKKEAIRLHGEFACFEREAS